MTDFTVFSAAISEQWAKLSAQGELYTTNADRDQIIDHYLASFPEGTNPIFRERTVHDCSCCKAFIRRVGALVSIDGETIWDVDVPYPFDVVAKAMSEYVKHREPVTIFRTIERRAGHSHDLEMIDGKTHRHNHFHVNIPRRYHHSNPAEAQGIFQTTKQVLARGLNEITLASLLDTLDMLPNIYRGEEHRRSLAEFIRLKRSYDNTDKYVIKNAGSPVARFRNTVIGSLVVDLSEGVDMEVAVGKFEAKVAPENYKRTKALITPRMVESAQQTITDLGLTTCLPRRQARLTDVPITSVFWASSSATAVMVGGLADILKSDMKQSAPDLDKATPMSMQDFLDRVVPHTTDMQVLVQNPAKLMTLTAPVDPTAPRLFKWPNNFAWSYNGDIADSSIKTRVKAAGGNVTAPFRVSLGWFNYDDLDIHVSCPGGSHIFYGNRRAGSGELDVDMNVGSNGSREAVENVCWNNPRDGMYRVEVKNYTRRENIDTGFSLEIESNGKIYRYSDDSSPLNQVTRRCLDIHVKDGSIVKIEPYANMTVGDAPSQEIWGIQTETFVPVSTLMASPNHWDEVPTGNLHWFFILDGCKNPDPVRSIYNEFLIGELTPHRKVFEILGARTKAPYADDQMSGVGFSSTRQDEEAIVKCDGRIYKVSMT
jgi:hypothetical protein